MARLGAPQLPQFRPQLPCGPHLGKRQPLKRAHGQRQSGSLLGATIAAVTFAVGVSLAGSVWSEPIEIPALPEKAPQRLDGRVDKPAPEKAPANADEAKKKLESRRKELETVQKRTKSLQSDVKSLAAERESLNTKLVDTATHIQESEGELT